MVTLCASIRSNSTGGGHNAQTIFNCKVYRPYSFFQATLRALDPLTLALILALTLTLTPTLTLTLTLALALTLTPDP